MTEMEVSLAQHLSAAVLLHNQLINWLLADALPLWDRHGVDRSGGGYFEALTSLGPQAPIEVAGEERRGRVLARQIYVFDVGERLGWRSPMSNPVEHGCDYLFSRMGAGEGLFHTSIHASTYEPLATFSLYEHAFYLFALARLSGSVTRQNRVHEAAVLCLKSLRQKLGKRLGGFEESTPSSLPLKSNPHMHLLEAAIAWAQATEGAAQQPWIELCRELIALCLTRFIDPHSGALREYFDGEWRPMAGDAGRVVEPGHQFEWAWLLTEWAAFPHCSADEREQCLRAAVQLADLGERWGVDPDRGVAINELWDDMTPKDSDAKLWPQTERVKAWCAILVTSTGEAARIHACRMIAAAVRGMLKYLRADVPGTWHELCTSQGNFPAGPSKASSFYHVVCAIEVLRKTVGADSRDMIYSPDSEFSTGPVSEKNI